MVPRSAGSYLMKKNTSQLHSSTRVIFCNMEDVNIVIYRMVQEEAYSEEMALLVRNV
ncbi:GL18360 [Drosophila persimilis]|uniref:GL18360 n=1 Tax=Drosophila persimilis TaxID=7234 RepID=B4HDD3_DROPE|nr:GL18360 [Drosophila persimilis]